MLQDILEQSAVQNYPIGMRRAVDDRVFRYSHAAEQLYAQSGAFVGKGTANFAGQNYWQGGGAMPIGAIIAPGAKQILFDNVESIPAHALRDGWIAGVADDATNIFCLRIRDNDVSSGAPGTTLCYLYHGMPHGMSGVASHRCYVYPNLYRDLLNMGGEVANKALAAVMCVPLIKVEAATPYFWGLTWGIFYCLIGLANMVACRDNEREFWFNQNGGVVHRAGNNAADPHFQRGGYVLMDGNNAHAAVTNGDQLAMLQLSP